MLLELFPFVILNNVMAFVNAFTVSKWASQLVFSDFLCFDISLFLLTFALRGVSNKHCLLPLFHCVLTCL